MSDAVRRPTAGEMRAAIYSSGEELGRAAAENTATVLVEAVQRRGGARMIAATGNSQLAFVEALRERTEIQWEKIVVFHMDEYVGLDEDHPASFRRWIRERIAEPLGPAAVHYLDGEVSDVEAECRRYEGLLREGAIDLVCMGIGENGHIAFNDPPVANFSDPVWVKAVELDRECRMQQVGEGHFPTLEDVPTHALTLTVPALLAPRSLQIVVPERRKAEAVRRTFRDPIGEACPATILRIQPRAVLFLDEESASLLD